MWGQASGRGQKGVVAVAVSIGRKQHLASQVRRCTSVPDRKNIKTSLVPGFKRCFDVFPGVFAAGSDVFWRVCCLPVPSEEGTT